MIARYAMNWVNRIVIAALLLAAPLPGAETLVGGRPSVVIEGSEAKLVVDLQGGSIVELRLGSAGVNPLVWANRGPAEEARPMSHFVCLDRWGAPSAAELERGMVFHGEATRVRWSLDAGPEAKQGALEARMSARLPIAGLRVERTLRLASNAACVRVQETVTNENKLGRVYNIVQHPTIGPPFLDVETLVDSNARQGFAQSNPGPKYEEPSAWWPRALNEGVSIDMRRLVDSEEPNVVSYVVEDEYGWVTASSPTAGLLIGYLWKRSEYPWLNLWRRLGEDGKPLARGLEFGTTGLHQPFPTLVKKGAIFGRPLLDYLDAGESRTRSYLMFLAPIPADYRGVAELRRGDRGIELIERPGGPGRALEVSFDAVIPRP